MTLHERTQVDLFAKETGNTLPANPVNRGEPLEGNGPPKAVCLFSSAGIGELGIRAAGVDTICANELVPYRAALYRRNFPEARLIEGDILDCRDAVIAASREALRDEELFLLYATPPCQGMSSNGMGRLRHERNRKNAPHEDERNRLIVPTMDVVEALRPRWLLLENVPGMRFTTIRDERGHEVRILDYIGARLGPEYVGSGEVVACEDFGIPQRRRRLISVFTRDPMGKRLFSRLGGSFLTPDLYEPKVTLRQAISHLPPLEAERGKNARPDYHPLHYVGVIDERKLWWIRNTKEGDTAYNNQCVNPECLYQGNALHRDVVDAGRATSSKATPIYCQRCGELLPRPTVLEGDGTARLLRGFHSAYRRMRWDEPARTITQNFIYEASDNKIHPVQNRCLSVLEALIVQTVSKYEYHLDVEGERVSTARIAEVLGESVPPYLMEKLCRHILAIGTSGGAVEAADAYPTAERTGARAAG